MHILMIYLKAFKIFLFNVLIIESNRITINIIGVTLYEKYPFNANNKFFYCAIELSIKLKYNFKAF